jgi:hypothetical protein
MKEITTEPLDGFFLIKSDLGEFYKNSSAIYMFLQAFLHVIS